MSSNSKNHPNQRRYQGKQFFSAGMGQVTMMHGEINTTVGWQTVFGRSVGRSNIFLVPFLSGTDGSSVAAMDYLLNKMVCMLKIHRRGHTTAAPTLSRAIAWTINLQQLLHTTSCTWPAWVPGSTTTERARQWKGTTKVPTCGSRGRQKSFRAKYLWWRLWLGTTGWRAPMLHFTLAQSAQLTMSQIFRTKLSWIQVSIAFGGMNRSRWWCRAHTVHWFIVYVLRH